MHLLKHTHTVSQFPEMEIPDLIVVINKTERVFSCSSKVKRYQHYFTRWEGHVKSSKLMVSQRSQIQDKITILEQNNSTLKDYTWLMQVFRFPLACLNSIKCALSHHLLIELPYPSLSSVSHSSLPRAFRGLYHHVQPHSIDAFLCRLRFPWVFLLQCKLLVGQ